MMQNVESVLHLSESAEVPDIGVLVQVLGSEVLRRDSVRTRKSTSRPWDDYIIVHVLLAQRTVTSVAHHFLFEVLYP
eukprot:900335-Rhodomonas_salina.1